jgi:pyruvate dehydrogenase E1 component alpha subunit
MSDPAKYRSKEEVEKMRSQHDPIEQLARMLVEGGMADDARLKQLDREVKEIVTASADFAQQSPEPDPSELWTDVLVEG